ncbi:MAG: hypothetical protein WA984_18940 [Phormidesmis sp.]
MNNSVNSVNAVTKDTVTTITTMRFTVTKATVSKVAIALCLLAPLALREISGALEPYPAVLQPSGAHKVSTADTLLEFRQTHLFAVQADGSEQQVDAIAFMGNIPSHYWEHLAIASYGLAEGKSQTASLGRWALTATTIKTAPPTERIEALAWIHDRLHAQGIDNANTLSIRYMKIFWDIESDTEIKRELNKQVDVDIKS